jgi:hypothetical protein
MFDDDDDRIATAPMEQGMVPRRILFLFSSHFCVWVCVMCGVCRCWQVFAPDAGDCSSRGSLGANECNQLRDHGTLKRSDGVGAKNVLF